MEQESDEALKKRCVDALAESDSLQGDERAERLVWLAQFSTCKPGQVIAGRIEPLSPMEEARVCYVNGNYIAVLLTATAFIDQAIVDELDERGIGAKPRTLREAVDVARQASVFPGDLLDQADRLRLVRNPFKHRKPDNHEHGLGPRFRARKMHPTPLLEQDAKEAIAARYEFFRLTLKPASTI